VAPIARNDTSGGSESYEIREEDIMRIAARILLVVAITLAAGAARAEEESRSTDSGSSSGYRFGLQLTIGEGMYFIHNDVYRSPVSLELVPSLGWSWFKFDLGLSTTLNKRS
jgi:hypothetical protein